jgi:hypothetical protein
VRKLLVFGGFAHDSQRILAAIYRLTFVGIELRLHVKAFELRIASHAYGQNGFAVFPLYDPQLAIGHGLSLAHPAERQ